MCAEAVLPRGQCLDFDCGSASHFEMRSEGAREHMSGVLGLPGTSAFTVCNSFPSQWHYGLIIYPLYQMRKWHGG